MLSIVIPHRNEDMLPFTVQRLQETLTITHEIIVVDDGSDQPSEVPAGVKAIRFDRPTGAQRARHTGIEAAGFDTVLVIDAHMNLWDKDWASGLVDYSRSHPSHVGCLTMLALEPGRMAMEDAKGKYHGAHLLPFDLFDQPEVHYSIRRRILVDKWNRAHTTGEVGCVLGGAYFFNRAWYRETLMCPWEELLGYGYLEANISIPNYLLGGKNVCIDVEIGHMFRPAAPYLNDLSRFLFNELYLAHAVIPDDGERDQLIAQLELPDDPLTRRAWANLDRSICRWYCEYLVEQGKRSWEQYKEEWMAPDHRY